MPGGIWWGVPKINIILNLEQIIGNTRVHSHVTVM